MGPVAIRSLPPSLRWGFSARSRSAWLRVCGWLRGLGSRSDPSDYEFDADADLSDRLREDGSRRRPAWSPRSRGSVPSERSFPCRSRLPLLVTVYHSRSSIWSDWSRQRSPSALASPARRRSGPRSRSIRSRRRRSAAADTDRQRLRPGVRHRTRPCGRTPRCRGDDATSSVSVSPPERHQSRSLPDSQSHWPQPSPHRLSPSEPASCSRSSSRHRCRATT